MMYKMFALPLTFNSMIYIYTYINIPNPSSFRLQSLFTDYIPEIFR